MSIMVKRESFMSAFHNVNIVTEETYVSGEYARYFRIYRDELGIYESPAFYGGSQDDIARNCDAALDVVRQMLKDTGFLTGEVFVN